MANWSTGFESDTTGQKPAASVSGSYGTLTWYSAPAGTSTDASVSTAVAQEGTKSLIVGTSARGATYYAASGIPATTYGRIYLNISTAPTTNTIIARYHSYTNNRSNVIGIDTSRRLYVATWAEDSILLTGTYSNLYRSSTNSLPLSEWFRIEFKLTATSAHGKVWVTTGGNGYNSTGAADIDSTELSGTSIGTIEQVQNGFESTGTIHSSGTWYYDGVALDDTAWVGSNAPVVTIAGTPSITLTGTSAATRVPLASAAGTLTATGAAVGGLLQTVAGAPSITLAGSADASVLTTHWAEAVGTITADSTNASSAVKGMAAAGVLTAGNVATAATNTAADGVVQALGSAKARIDGETTPGFLYGRVIKTTITS